MLQDGGEGVGMFDDQQKVGGERFVNGDEGAGDDAAAQPGGVFFGAEGVVVLTVAGSTGDSRAILLDAVALFGAEAGDAGSPVRWVSIVGQFVDRHRFDQGDGVGQAVEQGARQGGARAGNAGAENVIGVVHRVGHRVYQIALSWCSRFRNA